MLGKNMKKKMVLMLLIMLLMSAMMAPALAQPRVVGVQVGDWFKYEVKVPYFESTGPFPPPLGPLTKADNETNWQLYNVTGIVDDVINFTVTYNWKNGTTTYGTLDENVTFSMDMLSIGADMAEGDMVRDTFLFFGFYQWPALYLNASINLVNPNATRETNVLNYSGLNIYGSLYDYVFYWDKATGMRVYYENHGDVADSTAYGGGPAYKYTVKWELVDSGVNGVLVPDLTGPILLLTMMSITAITVPIALRCRRKKTLI
jgi:hypothetical protein